MQFGICTPVANAAAAKAAGWDFVEEHIQNFLQASVPDSQWTGDRIAAASPLPVLAANCLVPADLKITGPAADIEKLRAYMIVVAARARKCGIKTLVFGSGGARNIPDGFDRAAAGKQIFEFAKMAAALCAQNGVLLVAEHLNRKECNVINTVGEGEALVRQVNNPGFENLVDAYHFWLEKESLDDLQRAMPHIRHVHLADVEGRLAPGESGKADYRPFFRVLKQAGYDRALCVEALNFDIPSMGPRVLSFLKKQWDQA